MGCSQSALCVATLSQQNAPDAQQLEGQGPPLSKQRSVKLPPVRSFQPDAAKAAQSAAEKEDATEAAEAILLANQGINFRDTYVRATLVSYGGSCRVFTAVNKHTQEPVAIKTITKVRSADRHPSCNIAWTLTPAVRGPRACSYQWSATLINTVPRGTLRPLTGRHQAAVVHMHWDSCWADGLSTLL